ncbi:tetratricopeptide repeat protein [Gemmatimonadota bacterium]
MRHLRMMSPGRHHLLALMLLLMLIATACEKTPTGGATAAEKVALGWTAFEAGDITAAFSRFNEAISLDPLNAEAHHGMGWTRLLRGELSQAQSSFNSANTNGLTVVDADAGLSIVYRDLPDLNQAISKARTVLTSSSSWSFSHRTSIDWKDIRLVIAQCSYRQGEAHFDDAQTELDILDAGNGLDPEDSGTWIVGSVTYNTYAEALLMALEALESTIAG